MKHLGTCIVAYLGLSLSYAQDYSMGDYKMLVDTTTMHYHDELEGSFSNLYFSDLDSLEGKQNDEKVAFMKIELLKKGSIISEGDTERIIERDRFYNPERYLNEGEDHDQNFFFSFSRKQKNLYFVTIKDVETGERVHGVKLKTKKRPGTVAFHKKVYRKVGLK